MSFKPSPGIHVVPSRNADTGRPVTLILQCHTLPPHDVVGRVDVAAASVLQALIRKLKHQLDVISEETRARAHPGSCRAGGQVSRKPSLDEMDGE